MSVGERQRLPRIEALENLVVLALLRSGPHPASTLGSVFVFRPDDPAGDHANVYTTDTSLKAAWDTVPGPKWLLVDDSLASAVFSSAAIWDIDQTTFLSATGFGTLVIRTGVTFAAFANWWVDGGLAINNTSAASVFTTSGFHNVFIEGNATRISSGIGAAPFFHAANDFALNIYVGTNALLGDTAHAVLTIDGGVHAIVEVGGGDGIGGNLTNGAVVGAGTLVVGADSAAQLHPQAVAVTTTTFNSKASQVAYTATTVANWSGTNPTSVGNALDRIAAKIGPIA